MQIMKKRTLTLIVAILLLLLAVGSALAESTQTAPPEENGTFGQVTQIDGNTITIALASMGGSGGPTPQGNPPSDGNGQAQQGNPPDNNGQNPQGTPPSGGQGSGFGGSLTLTGETLSFTVSDATQITLRGGRDAQDTQGTLSDIQVGSVVTVVLDGETAATITVRQTPQAPAGN
jgi:hypothetical protein